MQEAPGTTVGPWTTSVSTANTSAPWRCYSGYGEASGERVVNYTHGVDINYIVFMGPGAGSQQVCPEGAALDLEHRSGQVAGSERVGRRQGRSAGGVTGPGRPWAAGGGRFCPPRLENIRT